MKDRTTTDGVYCLPRSWERRATTRARLLRDLGPVIYYLRVGALVKIGYTGDLAQRIRDYPPDVKLLAWRTNATFEMEQEIHAALTAHTAARVEWYYPTPEIIAVINQARIDCGIAKYAEPA